MADPDDPYGTEYCFYRKVIDVIFASSVGEEGVLKAWSLAEKAWFAPPGWRRATTSHSAERRTDFHISVLDGRKPDEPGVSPNVCFVVFDPELTHVWPSKAKKWVS
jgi:hypothetical protein